MVDPASKKTSDDHKNVDTVVSEEHKNHSKISAEDVFGGNPDVFADMEPTAFQPIDPETGKPVDHTEETQAPFLHDSVQATKELEEDVVTDTPQKEDVLGDDSSSMEEEIRSGDKETTSPTDGETVDSGIVNNTMDDTKDIDDNTADEGLKTSSDPFVDTVEDSDEQEAPGDQETPSMDNDFSLSEVKKTVVDSVFDDTSSSSSIENVDSTNDGSVEQDSHVDKEKNADYYDPFVDTVEDQQVDNNISSQKNIDYADTNVEEENDEDKQHTAISQDSEDEDEQDTEKEYEEQEKKDSTSDTNTEEYDNASTDVEDKSVDGKKEDDEEQDESKDGLGYLDTSEVVDPFLRDDNAAPDDSDSLSINSLDSKSSDQSLNDEEHKEDAISTEELSKVADQESKKGGNNMRDDKSENNEGLSEGNSSKEESDTVVPDSIDTHIDKKDSASGEDESSVEGDLGHANVFDKDEGERSSEVGLDETTPQNNKEDDLEEDDAATEDSDSENDSSPEKQTGDVDKEDADEEPTKPVNEVQGLIDGFVDPFISSKNNTAEDDEDGKKDTDSDISSPKDLENVNEDTDKEDDEMDEEEKDEEYNTVSKDSEEEDEEEVKKEQEDREDDDLSGKAVDEYMDEKDEEEKTTLHAKFITLRSLVDTAQSLNDADDLRLVGSDNDALYISYLFSQDDEDNAIVITKEATDRKKDEAVSHVMRLFINDDTELELIVDDVSLFTESLLADDDKSRMQVLDKLDKFVFLLEEFIKEKEKEQENKQQRSQARSDFREF